MIKTCKFFKWCMPIIFLLAAPIIFAQAGINDVGSFEQDLPSFWSKGSEPGGSTLSWAKDEFVSMGRSLKIEKETTGESAEWVSDNMVDLWSDKHFANVDILMGFSYKTMNVNTNPATEDEKWYVNFTFMREDGSVIGESKFELDQSAASSDGWVVDTTDIGEVILPEDSWTTIIKFVGGKDATGTVWVDNIILDGRGGWAGQNWNTHVGVPTGWFYWLPPTGGNDGFLTAGYENTIITDEAAYDGDYSLKFADLEGIRDGFVGTQRYMLSDVLPGDKIRISVWLKGEDLEPDSVASIGDQATFSITPIFHDQIGNNDGWGQIAAWDLPLNFPNATSFDWKQFFVDVEVPENAVSLSIRMHPLGRFQGTVYCDLLEVEKLEVPEIHEIGSFEQDLPSFWTKGSEPGGSTLSWAKDEFVSMGRSLKIEKEATGESAEWESENMVDLWSDKHFANVDILMGFSYKTMDVNTNPANDDEKWYVNFTFMREDGSEIGNQKFELDQSVASSDGWVVDTTDIGEVILPEDSWTTIIKFVGGKDATGTVWVDNIILDGRGGWAGQNWNTHVGVPTGWFYWLPPTGGNDGFLTAGYENTIITDEAAYDGDYSLKFADLEGIRDGFVGTQRYAIGQQGQGLYKGTDLAALNDLAPGDIIRISVWLKGEDLEPDSVASIGDQATFSITPIFHDQIGNNDGWGQIAAWDLPLNFPNATSFDWKQFFVDVEVPENAVSLSIRMHPLGRFQGTVYCDLLEVQKLEVADLQAVGSFEQDLPSFWTKGSEPGGSTLSWAKDEFVSMGRSLKIEKEATGESAEWVSENMVDLWSEKHFANVDILMGFSYKTMNVNTNPATEDEKWYVNFTFMREDGSEIGNQKFELDQSVASSDGWVVDTTDIGEVILPEDSWTTIIKFVGGKDATGTVWVDNIILDGRGGWAGQNWNAHVGVPTGWFYWLPPTGGNDGFLTAGYENTIITDEAAYDGDYSLKFADLEGTRDGFVGTQRYAINGGIGTQSGSINNSPSGISGLEGLNPGDIIRISVWLKGEDLEPDSVASIGDQATFSITPIFHDQIGNNDGWGQIAAWDLPLNFPNATSFDWKQFFVDVEVPENAVSLSIRMHPLGRFQGTVYCDLLEVKRINNVTDVNENTQLPTEFALDQNYPNPFNPSTVISYSLSQNSLVTIKIYDMLGREIKTLVNREENAGVHLVQWNGTNSSGQKVTSGTYIYRIQAGDFVEAKKMLLLK